jgi:hypothetical protein
VLNSTIDEPLVGVNQQTYWFPLTMESPMAFDDILARDPKSEEEFPRLPFRSW